MNKKNEKLKVCLDWYSIADEAAEEEVRPLVGPDQLVQPWQVHVHVVIRLHHVLHRPTRRGQGGAITVLTTSSSKINTQL